MMTIKTSRRSAKTQSLLSDDNLTFPPVTTKATTTFGDNPAECNTTGTVTPLAKITAAASLLVSQSFSIMFDKKVAVKVTNRTE